MTEKKKLVPLLVAFGFLMLIPIASEIDAKKGKNSIPDTALLPDIIPSIPKHLQVQNAQQTETLRFTNAWGNTGDGNLEFFPIIPEADVSETETQDSLQR
ncbi:MAG: hypothetical protein GWN01_13135, partial [Nitrosopumilaceae archaeon]|nr:hypothetical protein [Nitrosopumilaceae archaeon]NIU01808.1 hypothetical protein [Nitrosopumilaceae archaeon]NIU88216.1 hypothetical protein [Nitrosopumilaceae archaeon]NIV66529.1 hypothetical protein [Nitrosopumilaceae archaeon]NIX62410.1 hypothetical protein [Nitrosopumilaceae archaeon]